jgi:hypothetical protein
MFYIREKQLMVTKSAWREMDCLGLPIQRIISIIEEGRRELEGPKAGKWLAQGRVAGKFILVRYIELPDKLVVINIGQTTRKVL